MSARGQLVSAPSARTQLACRVGRLAGWSSRRLGRGRGGTIVGRVALAVAPQVLAELTAGRFVVLVSGTNGKTTTTTFTATALRTLGPVVTNAEGDNLMRGLASAAASTTWRREDRLVLEVDEIVLPGAIEQTRPAVVVLLNLSRDQLDRSGEVMGHVGRWSRAFAATPETIIVANADDPLVAAVVNNARPGSDNVVWVAAGSAWRADAQLCVSCGSKLSAGLDYRCPRCGFARPLPAWSVGPDGLQGPAGAVRPFELAVPGRANRGNAAMAVAAAAVAGAPPEASLRALAAIGTVSGRYQHAQVDGRDLQFLLAKNPAGWCEALDVLAERDTPVVISINARDADGTDPSWLWDTPFEQLRGRTVVATGERRWDLAVRLTYADVTHVVADDVSAALATLPLGRCDIIANYTAFRTAQQRLLGRSRGSEGSP